MNRVKRFKQYGRQSALISADLFDASDWPGCLVVAGVSSSLGAYVRFLLIFLRLLPIAPQVGLRAIGDVVYMNTDHLTGEGTRKRRDDASHLGSAGEPMLETLATAALETEERQTLILCLASWLAHS